MTKLDATVTRNRRAALSGLYKKKIVNNQVIANILCWGSLIFAFHDLLCSLSQDDLKTNLWSIVSAPRRDPTIKVKVVKRYHSQNSNSMPMSIFPTVSAIKIEEAMYRRRLNGIRIDMVDDGAMNSSNQNFNSGIEKTGPSLIDRQHLQSQETTQKMRSVLGVSKIKQNLVFCIPNGTVTASGDSIAQSGTVLWSSYVTAIIPEFLKGYHLSLGGKEGNCIDNCPSLCHHQPCFNDMLMIGDTGCFCRDKTNHDFQSQCGDNTICLPPKDEEQERCECIAGYSGDPLTGCTQTPIPTEKPRSQTTTRHLRQSKSPFRVYCGTFIQYVNVLRYEH
jgi:hypothetical protein